MCIYWSVLYKKNSQLKLSRGVRRPLKIRYIKVWPDSCDIVQATLLRVYRLDWQAGLNLVIVINNSWTMIEDCHLGEPHNWESGGREMGKAKRQICADFILFWPSPKVLTPIVLFSSLRSPKKLQWDSHLYKHEIQKLPGCKWWLCLVSSTTRFQCEISST